MSTRESRRGTDVCVLVCALLSIVNCSRAYFRNRQPAIDVMVTVAMNFDAPIKLQFPRLATDPDTSIQFSILGLLFDLAALSACANSL